MSTNTHLVDFDDLCRLSHKSKPSAVRRWASEQGIRLGAGPVPWTTIEAVNAALGLKPSNEPRYRPEDIL